MPGFDCATRLGRLAIGAVEKAQRPATWGLRRAAVRWGLIMGPKSHLALFQYKEPMHRELENAVGA